MSTPRNAMFCSGVGLLFLAAATTALGQCGITKLRAGEGVAAGDYLGWSVDVDGTLLIAGAWLDDDNGPKSGAAHVFRFNGTSWVHEAKLLPTDGAPNGRFGSAVAISQNVALVGSWGDGQQGANAGAVYVFRRTSGSEWIQEAKLLPIFGTNYGRFGVSVDVEGDLAVIGSDGNSENGAGAGSAYVYRFDGANWFREAKLLASDGASADYFGWRAALSGAVVLIGAPGEDDKGPDAGAAYVFRYDGVTWNQDDKLLASDGFWQDWFGIAVDLAGDAAVVSARQDDDKGKDSGSVYVFRYNGSSWLQQAKLVPADGTAGDLFGIDVSLDDVTLAVGSWADRDNGYGAGSVYLYRYNGMQWALEIKLLPNDGSTKDYFGSAVAVSGETVIVGAYGGDDYGDASGSVYVRNVDYVATCDLNCDGYIDSEDISYFIIALSDPAAWQAQVCPRCDLLRVGDTNGDGVFDQGDVAGFLDCLTDDDQPGKPNPQRS